MKATANGISVNYTLEGPANAPVVTMSHSLATDLGMWDPTVPALIGRFRVLRYETRGHGKTEAPKGAYPFLSVLAKWAQKAADRDKPAEVPKPADTTKPAEKQN